MDYCRISYGDWISGKSSTSNRRGIDTPSINSVHTAYRFQQTWKFNVKKSHSICLFLEQRPLAYTTRSVSRSTEVHCSLLSTSLSIIKGRLYQRNFSHYSQTRQRFSLCKRLILSRFVHYRMVFIITRWLLIRFSTHQFSPNLYLNVIICAGSIAKGNHKAMPLLA